MYSHELIMLCITGSIEYKPCHKFSNLTINWAWKRLVHISDGTTLDFWYFGAKIPLSNYSCRKQTGISMCLTLGVTILASTIEIKLVLSYQCTVGSLVWRTKDSVYFWIALVLLIDLYMYQIFPYMESEDISSLIWTFQQTSASRRVLWIL